MIFILFGIILVGIAFSLMGCGGEHWEDGDGTIPPQTGIVTFFWDTDHDRLVDLKPQWLRISVDQGYDINAAVDRIRWFKSKGIQVLLCVYDKTNMFNTPALIREYAKRLKNQVIWQVANEVNILLPGEPNNYLEPDEYNLILMNSRDYIKQEESSAMVVMAGLANGFDKKKDKQYPAVDYVKKIHAPLTDAWCFHNYNSVNNYFYRFIDTVQKIDRNKPMYLTEFGTNKTDENVKIKVYDEFMNKCKLNKVSQAYLYAWDGGAEFAIKTRPAYYNHIKRG